MTGPEHYREAERLLNGPNVEAYETTDEGDARYERDRADNLNAAAIHATLALAAATASPRSLPSSRFDADGGASSATRTRTTVIPDDAPRGAARRRTGLSYTLIALAFAVGLLGCGDFTPIGLAIVCLFVVAGLTAAAIAIHPSHLAFDDEPRRWS